MKLDKDRPKLEKAFLVNNLIFISKLWGALTSFASFQDHSDRSVEDRTKVAEIGGWMLC